jgi:hypothetical protein
MQKISLKWLGITAIICAPAMCININFFLAPQHENSNIGGILDFLFITGWLCSICGFIRLQAAGAKWPGKAVLYTQLVMLCLADSLEHLGNTGAQ